MRTFFTSIAVSVLLQFLIGQHVYRIPLTRFFDIRSVGVDGLSLMLCIAIIFASASVLIFRRMMQPLRIIVTVLFSGVCSFVCMYIISEIILNGE